MGGDPQAPAFSDAAKRMSDAVTLALTVHGLNASGKYMAFTLEHAETDHEIYDNREDAIRHTCNKPAAYCYVQLPYTGMPPADAERFLIFHRKLYQAGMRMPHPEDQPEIHMPQRIEQWSEHGIVLPDHLMPNRRRNQLWRPPQ